MTVAGTSCSIGTSVGVAFAAPGESADRLIDRADAAMYEQKRSRPTDRRSTGARPLVTEFS
jgi:PleD family two-component response regulator